MALVGPGECLCGSFGKTLGTLKLLWMSLQVSGELLGKSWWVLEGCWGILEGYWGGLGVVFEVFWEVQEGSARPQKRLGKATTYFQEIPEKQ